jgi:hypothetical protein
MKEGWRERMKWKVVIVGRKVPFYKNIRNLVRCPFSPWESL